MPDHSNSWRSLVPGAIIAVVLASAVFLIMRYLQPGALRGEQITLHAPLSGARGIMKGSQVWLAGRSVGEVREVRFQPAAVDSSARVVVVLDVLAQYRDQIRSDSYAQIRAGTSLIGAPVVHLTPGSSGARLLADGDTLLTRPQNDIEGISSQVALASRHLPEIISNVKLISTQLEGASGTAGALLDEAGTQQLGVVGARAGELARRLTTGNGTVGLAMRERSGPMARAQAAMAGADTLRALLLGEQAAIGRFRRDSTLLQTVGSLRNEISIVKALLDESRGTAGRVLHDKAVWNELARLEREMGLLMADLKRRPLRYVHF